MGMVTSCCGRRPRKSRLHSEHDLMTSTRKKGHRRDISATYSANDFVMTLDQLNINRATEEELMTLPGITRNVARNILQYRNHIGGFRKAEDLALVSGVGANKLSSIRMEIYCGKFDPGNLSVSGSRRSSSHRLNALAKANTEITKVDVNKATQAELSTVSGIGTDLAERIVEYRSEVGQYKFLTDVSKVPEIGTYYFEKIRQYLTVDDNDSLCSTSTSVSIVDDFSVDSASSLPLLQNKPNGTLPAGSNGSRKRHVTSSTQTDNSLVPSHFTTMPRRNSRRHGLPSKMKTGRLRVASWNLQGLGLEKVHNAGVREVICLTLLENGISLLACQDITENNALDEICSELNNPILGPVKAWTGHRGKWTCVTAPSVDRNAQSTRSCGFLWDTTQGVQLKHSYCIKLSSNRTISSPHASSGMPIIGRFSFSQMPYLSRTTTVHAEFSLLCVLLERRAGDQMLIGESISSVEAVAHTIEQYFPEKQSMILACDGIPDHEVIDLSPLTSLGFQQVTARNGMANGVQKVAGLKYTNNLLLSQDLETYYKGTPSGSSGLISEGLSHPLIPSGWRWGGVVSDHRLAWVELVFPST